MTAEHPMAPMIGHWRKKGHAASMVDPLARAYHQAVSDLDHASFMYWSGLEDGLPEGNVAVLRARAVDAETRERTAWQALLEAKS